MKRVYDNVERRSRRNKTIRAILHSREQSMKENVSAQDLKSLRALTEEKKLKRYLCVSLGPRRRNLENVTILPLREFLEALWSREYSS